jgi:hypothetical protein
MIARPSEVFCFSPPLGLIFCFHAPFSYISFFFFHFLSFFFIFVPKPRPWLFPVFRSRLTNFIGILSEGLRIAPPSAPVTGVGPPFNIRDQRRGKRETETETQTKKKDANLGL